MTIRLDPDEIRRAVGRIPAVFRESPQFVSEPLSERAGRPVVVKVESLNPIRAFKGRGAWLAMQELVRSGAAGPDHGVVVASTGNFGQAVAFAGRAQGVPVSVFAGDDANPTKLDRISAMGAEVRRQGHDFDAARQAAAVFAAAGGQRLLIDGEDPWIAIGAGTLALEVTDAVERGDLPPIAAVYVPVGNGALISGVGAWIRHASTTTRVVGVQSERAPSMTISWREGRPIETPTAETRAGGINVRVPVPEALEMMHGVVDEMLLVSEEALADARAMLESTLGVTAELAAAASLAGLLSRPPDADRAALLIVTGSNVEQAA
jgi:threonine dehydratase